MQLWVVCAGALVTGIVTLLPLRAGRGPEPRQIVLVARDMTFYLADDPRTPNPTLRLAPDEDVRVVLRNEEAGVTHDFAVQSLGVAMTPIKGGGVGSVMFRAPGMPGRYEYVCRPHGRMMRGGLEVE